MSEIKNIDHSGAWYLLPFLFGFIGGLIMWLTLRDTNVGMAQNGMVFGIVWSLCVGFFYTVIFLTMITM